MFDLENELSHERIASITIRVITQIQAVKTGSLFHIFCVDCGYLVTHIIATGSSLPKEEKHNCYDFNLQRQQRKLALAQFVRKNRASKHKHKKPLRRE